MRNDFEDINIDKLKEMDEKQTEKDRETTR
jgi:hypothetical protein